MMPFNMTRPCFLMLIVPKPPLQETFPGRRVRGESR
jgi:hypothetical protein